ncbi:hypothetical protein HYH02_001006 [Chlamydomonas schloesseri]|uniref:Uncharacterized protein n=1 Tax=Chlamydomonas schloesseri TaxID=2026947 RepID=A0A835WTJ9_9CHLO|nr:hypothetical protein HYH02_001006 [Chlamydomonas schloesseri]|eukprot:KAG2453959.1 hypothetical protein HYH02_001006 [Chlamydomonas schloesseri]
MQPVCAKASTGARLAPIPAPRVRTVRTVPIPPRCAATTPAEQSPEPASTRSPASPPVADQPPTGTDDGGLPGGGGGDNGSQNGGRSGRGSGSTRTDHVAAFSGGGGDGDQKRADKGGLQALVWPAIAFLAMVAACIAAWILGQGVEAAATAHGKSVEAAGTSVATAATTTHGKSVEAAGKSVEAGLWWLAIIGAAAYAFTPVLAPVLLDFLRFLGRRGGDGGAAAGGQGVS